MANHTRDKAPAQTVVRLACGVPLACERVEGARSVAVSWLLPAGCAYDPEKKCGISSLASELVLRGAGSMDSRALADAFDRAGVLHSADPSVRHISISATATGDRLNDALTLMSEMVLRPRFDPASIEPAKALALQSLASLKDDPQERAVLGARHRHLPAPFNRSTYGDEEGIGAIDRAGVRSWWASHAAPAGSVLGVAGDVDPEAVFAHADAILGGWGGPATAPPSPGPAPARGYAHETEESNQVQVVLMQDGPAETHPDADLERLAVSVLSGGMSGRLFTQVREVRGLCYSVSASYRADQDRGSVTSYVGTTPDRAQESLDVLFDELTRINLGDVTGEELDRAKIGARSRLVFSGESTGARAGAIASDIARLGRARSLHERLESIARIELDELNGYLRRRTPGRATIQTLGPAELTPPAGA